MDLNVQCTVVYSPLFLWLQIINGCKHTMYWYDPLFLVWSFVFGILFLIDFFQWRWLLYSIHCQILNGNPSQFVFKFRVVKWAYSTWPILLGLIQ